MVIPPYDWLGYPYIPTRYTHIFQRIGQHDEVHVLRFRFTEGKRTRTHITIHEMDDHRFTNLAVYYVANAGKHYEKVNSLINENNIDVVVNSNLLAAYVAAKAVGNRANIVFDLCDHFPSSAAGYYFNVQSLLGKIAMLSLEKLLKKNLGHAHHVVTPSHELCRYVETIGFEGPVSLMPNGVDDFFLERKFNSEGERIREQYGLGDSLVIGYLGSIEFWLHMSPLLSAIKQLKRKYDIKLLIVGSRLRTNATNEIRRQLRSLRIEERVVWPDRFVSYHDVPFWISAMDICTIPFNCSHPTAYYSAPIKLLEYLALEKPVFSTPVPEVLAVAKNCVSSVLTADDYRKEIRSYIKDPTDYLRKGKEGKLIAERYTWTRIAKEYGELLRRLERNPRNIGEKSETPRFVGSAF